MSEPAPATRPALGPFERGLSLWVALCIVVGIVLGHLAPGVFEALASFELARINLAVGVLIWVMIVPMLMRVDFGALAGVPTSRSKKRRSRPLIELSTAARVQRSAESVRAMVTSSSTPASSFRSPNASATWKRTRASRSLACDRTSSAISDD